MLGFAVRALLRPLVCVVGTLRLTTCGDVSDAGCRPLRLRPEKACSSRTSLVEGRGGSHAPVSLRRPKSSETLCFACKCSQCVHLPRSSLLRQVTSARHASAHVDERHFRADCCVRSIGDRCILNASCVRDQRGKALSIPRASAQGTIAPDVYGAGSSRVQAHALGLARPVELRLERGADQSTEHTCREMAFGLISGRCAAYCHIAREAPCGSRGQCGRGGEGWLLWSYSAVAPKGMEGRRPA
jgi:hypothetical protein